MACMHFVVWGGANNENGHHQVAVWIGAKTGLTGGSNA